MYLLDASSLQHVRIDGNPTGPYAILSHVWQGHQEVQYEDTTSLPHLSTSGAVKTRSFCKLIQQEDYDYIADENMRTLCWVDTCCIDKKSSAELSEAINSMFLWYKSAAVCIAYLQDVNAQRSTPTFEKEFSESRWFKRCWTLQELLAPKRVVFYNSSWVKLGDKVQLALQINKNTGIDIAALRNERNVLDYSIAQRFSWAATRQATRPEDVAYSLMGLFDVNMPMLYGEGHKAFRRLQDAILEEYEDDTIFAWSSDFLTDTHKTQLKEHCGLLAPSPDCFKGCQYVVPTDLYRRRSSLTTATGSLVLEMTISTKADNDDLFLAILNAARLKDQGEEEMAVIYITPVDSAAIPYIKSLDTYSAVVKFRHKRRMAARSAQKYFGFEFFQILASNFYRYDLHKNIKLFDNVKWMPVEGDHGKARLFVTKRNQYGPMCNIYRPHFMKSAELIQLGFTHNMDPVCLVFDPIWWAAHQNDPEGRVVVGRLQSSDSTVYEKVEWTPFTSTRTEKLGRPHARSYQLTETFEYQGFLALKGDKNVPINRWKCKIPIMGEDYASYSRSKKTLILELSSEIPGYLRSVWVFTAYLSA